MCIDKKNKIGLVALIYLIKKFRIKEFKNYSLEEALKIWLRSNKMNQFAWPNRQAVVGCF